ncbi:MAG: hypothetical protein AAF645_25850, partial [Myxococcota bacterium]
RRRHHHLSAAVGGACRADARELAEVLRHRSAYTARIICPPADYTRRASLIALPAYPSRLPRAHHACRVLITLAADSASSRRVKRPSGEGGTAGIHFDALGPRPFGRAGSG